MNRKSEVPEAPFVDFLPDLNKDLEQDDSVSCDHILSQLCEAHTFLAPEEITSELGMRRLQENKKNLHKKKDNGKIYCYRTKKGEWVPELRDPVNTFLAAHHSGFVRRAVHKIMADSLNFQGRFFRKGDGLKVATHFDGAAARDQRIKPWPRPLLVFHEENDPVGRMQSSYDDISPTSRPRIFHRMDRQYLVPELDQEKLDTEPLPFESTVTDVMTIAGFNLKTQQWMLQPQPYGNIELPPWKSVLHGSEGFTASMVFYKDGEDIYGFRPDLNLGRVLKDAEKLGFKKMTLEMLMAMLRAQLIGDRRWIPSVGNPAGNCYYLRFTGFPNVDGPKLDGPNRKIILVGTPIGGAELFTTSDIAPVDISNDDLQQILRRQHPNPELNNWMQKVA